MPSHEPRTWKIIRSLIRKGDVFVDVGAHVGTYTIPVAKIVGSNGIVVALEPSPFNYQILRRNVEINELRNCILINKAAWSKRAKLQFYYTTQATGISSLFPEWTKYHPLDDILKEVPPIDRIRVLKIDVEGAEVEVLKGAREVLKITDYVIFEAVKTLEPCLRLLPSDFKVSRIEMYNFLASRRIS